MNNEIVEIVNSIKNRVDNGTIITVNGSDHHLIKQLNKLVKLLNDNNICEHSDPIGYEDKNGVSKCMDCEKPFTPNKIDKYTISLINELIDIYENPDNSNSQWKETIIFNARQIGYGY